MLCNFSKVSSTADYVVDFSGELIFEKFLPGLLPVYSVHLFVRCGCGGETLRVVRCSVLQHVAVCCSMLQCLAVCCSAFVRELWLWEREFGGCVL